MMATTYNLLFVCTGNTCRSPMAVAVARRLIDERGWSHVAVDSAGVAVAGGSGASEQAVAAVAEAGMDLSEHVAKSLTQELVTWADLVLVMSDAHLHAVERLGGGEKVARLTDFARGDEAGYDIEDPFGADLASYRTTLQQLEQAMEAVLARLEPILSP